jgi:2-oxoglutarate dehydrogenase E1 component
LIERGLIDEAGVQALMDGYRRQLDRGEQVADVETEPRRNEYAARWHDFDHVDEPCSVDTAVPLGKIHELAEKILTLPPGFQIHNRVKRIMDDRRKMAAGQIPMDWGFAEIMAYATLIDQGHKLRLVGQDSGRGTFFHRHAVLHNQQDGDTLIPLQTINPVANGAQVVIDQFIASGEAKWGRLCGLTMFLPHGYEGQGPEHSSARLERFMQLCAHHNIQVCVPSTPAQMFHLLRRQVMQPTRKPLVVMTPKSLLRSKAATSKLEVLTGGRFQQVIGDRGPGGADEIRRVVFCAGKVYYDLAEKRDAENIREVAVMRCEQLYPFPEDDLRGFVNEFPNATEVVWCQEEPQNQGAWYQIRHHLQACITDRHQLKYVGRPHSASPAVGHYTVHIEEQQALVNEAIL